MHEPFLLVAQQLLTPLHKRKKVYYHLTMHDHFLIAAQQLLTPLQLPTIKERKFDHTHDNA
jgi:hypothetical protein